MVMPNMNGHNLIFALSTNIKTIYLCSLQPHKNTIQHFGNISGYNKKSGPILLYFGEYTNDKSTEKTV